MPVLKSTKALTQYTINVFHHVANLGSKFFYRICWFCYPFSTAGDTLLFIFGDLDCGAFLEAGLKILLYLFYLLCMMHGN
jgi:hypothetical protein